MRSCSTASDSVPLWSLRVFARSARDLRPGPCSLLPSLRCVPALALPPSLSALHLARARSRSLAHTCSLCLSLACARCLSCSLSLPLPLGPAPTALALSLLSRSRDLALALAARACQRAVQPLHGSPVHRMRDGADAASRLPALRPPRLRRRPLLPQGGRRRVPTVRARLPTPSPPRARAHSPFCTQRPASADVSDTRARSGTPPCAFAQLTRVRRAPPAVGAQARGVVRARARRVRAAQGEHDAALRRPQA